MYNIDRAKVGYFVGSAINGASTGIVNAEMQTVEAQPRVEHEYKHMVAHTGLYSEC